MQFIRPIWAAFVNVVAIGIFLGMLSVASSPFETIVVAGMALIYASIVTYGSLLVRSQIATSIAHTNQFIFLAKLHHTTDKNEEIAGFEEDTRHVWNEFQTKNIEYYINSFFILVLWLIAITSIILVLYV